MTWPADDCTGPYRAFRYLAKFASEGTGIAHVWSAIVAKFAGGLAIRSIVRGEDNDRIIVDAKFLERVKYSTDVDGGLNGLVAEIILKILVS